VRDSYVFDSDVLLSCEAAGLGLGFGVGGPVEWPEELSVDVFEMRRMRVWKMEGAEWEKRLDM
jgi:hypothetical protein